MFDKTDSEDWARCPECRTYFQIKNAAARDIPQLVVTQDEALLAEEESETGRETVCSALETRWDNRRTLDSTSLQTIAEFEAPAMSAEQDDQEVSGGAEKNDNIAPDGPSVAGNDAQESPQPAPSADDKLTDTAADSSPIDDWSELPLDEAEAQARAEQAGDTPDDLSAPSSTPTLRLHRSHAGKEDASRDKSSSDSGDDSGDRFDKWFQTKKTIADFDPPASDDLEIEIDDLAGDAPADDAAASADLDEIEEPFVEVESDSADEPSQDPESPAPAKSEDDRKPVAAWSPPNLGERGGPNWARPHRKRSMLRTLLMSGIGGVFGLVLGYYALLWLSGPSGDFLDVAEYLPAAMLPADFRSPRASIAANESEIGDVQAQDGVPEDFADPVDAEPLSQPSAGDVEGIAGDVDESNAVEPAEFAAPVAAPAAAPEHEDEVSRISNAPSFTADELAVALRTAQDAQPSLVAGDLTGTIEVKRTKGKSYALLCDLAQKASFVDATSRPEYVAPLMKETSELFQKTLANTKTREEVAQIVRMWIESPNRKHGGIFFAGHVAREVQQGPIVEWQIDLGHESIPVLVDPAKADVVESPARPVVILGWIVDKPAEQVTGYTGQAEQAVWAGHIIPLE